MTFARQRLVFVRISVVSLVWQDPAPSAEAAKRGIALIALYSA